MNEKLKYKDITEKIIGSAFEVRKFLGNGFQVSDLSAGTGMGNVASESHVQSRD